METSVGSCTRGINVALIPSEGEWRAKSDFMLVMDTEGLCNPNFMGEKWYNRHNNWLAALAILGPDACCLLSNNEDDTVVRTVLPFAMLCHHNAQETLSRAGFSARKLFFVYNKIDPAAANECLKENRLSMLRTLEERKEELKKVMEESPGGKGNPFSLINQSQFSYLGPDLNDPRGYGKNVLALRKSIDEAFGDTFEGGSLKKWWEMFSLLLSALDQQDFALSFKSLVEMKEAMERSRFIGELEAKVDCKWQDAYAQVSHDMTQEFQSKGNLDAADVDEWENKLINYQMQNEPKNLAKFLTWATNEVNAFLQLDRHRDAKHVEETKWNEFLRDLDSFYKIKLHNMYYRFQREKKLEAELELCFELRLKGILKDGLKRQHMKVNPNLRTHEFDHLFARELAKLQFLYKVINVGEIVDRSWPLELGLAEYRDEWETSPGLEKSVKGLSIFVKGLKGKFERGMSEEENLQVEIGEFLSNMESSNEFCEPAIRQGVKSFVKIIRSSKADQVMKTKIANGRKPELVAVLESKTRLWESEHNLFVKFKSRKAEFREMFEVLCEGLSKQETAQRKFLLWLWAESIPEYVRRRTVDDHVLAVRGKAYLSDWQAMAAEVNLDILERMGSDVTGAIAALRSEGEHLLKVQEKLMQREVKNDPSERHEKLMKTAENIFDKELRALVARKLLDSGKGAKGELSGVEMKELIIECCPPGLYFRQIALSSVEELDSVKTDMFLNHVVSDIRSTQWQSFEDCKWSELYSPTWNSVREQLPKAREGLKLLCQERCPTCRAPCIYHSGHADRHDCYHQPTGLNGWLWKKRPTEGDDRNCVFIRGT